MRPRVLVEHADPRAGIAVARALHDVGFAVATCPGPTQNEPCPLLTGSECSLALRADVIVSNLTAHPDGRSVAACLRAQLPRTPLLRNVEPHEAAWVVREALGS